MTDSAKGRVPKLCTFTPQEFRSAPLTDARQSASDRGVYCRSTVDSHGSVQSLAHDLFLIDFLYTCAETDSVDRAGVDMEVDVSTSPRRTSGFCVCLLIHEEARPILKVVISECRDHDQDVVCGFFNEESSVSQPQHLFFLGTPPDEEFMHPVSNHFALSARRTRALCCVCGIRAVAVWTLRDTCTSHTDSFTKVSSMRCRWLRFDLCEFRIAS